MNKKALSFLMVALMAPSLSVIAQHTRTPLPFKVVSKMPDVAELPAPSQVQLTGWLGKRVTNNEQNRLVKVDLKPLLEGYQQRPGNHPWIGEHIGKWLHAATLAWANTGDAKLKAKMDGAVHDLIATQEPDGYLGTYSSDKRFGLYPNADWDVWSHKYNLMGLLTYYQYTGSQPALNACRRMGDLLINTFGPGKKSINSAGTHMGMAATSVLEPVVLLYRHTGDARYLDFAKYIVKAWEEPGAPHILKTLTNVKAVNKTANGKAYEMLSNLVGLCELARVTGDKTYLIPAQNGWADVVKNQLYITGTASYGEHFHDPHDLPNAPGFSIGETCVTVTWIQLTSQLLRLTGEAKYGDELERSYYNHLAAAQRPDGAEWCYYTSLEGAKPYGPGINCCVSSGPRGMAMAPLHAYAVIKHEGQDVLAVNLFEASKASLTLNGQPVTITQTTQFPRFENSDLTFHMAKPARFGLRVRAPQWAEPMTIRAGKANATKEAGWIVLPSRLWKNGDKITLQYHLRARRVNGAYGNVDKAAVMWGPMVLAVDEALNKGIVSSTLAFDSLHKVVRPTADTSDAKVAAPRLEFETFLAGWPHGKYVQMVPFAEAGTKGSRYRIWLWSPGKAPKVTLSLLFGGEESRNAQGNQNGSISDGEPSSFVVTYDNTKHTEDWFAITPEKPVTISRIVYSHGQTFHDGGWFDASPGKPRIEVKRTANGAWETVGTLEDYPETTATDSKGIKMGQEFTLRLNTPIKATAVRVVGVPAHGDNPAQSFASCAELQAFAR